MTLLETVAIEAIRPMVTGFVAAAPDILSGLVFLAISYPVVKAILWGVKRGLKASGRKDVVVHLGALVAGTFLWFGVALVFLSLVGLESIAASLGTATGFIGLGVALALKDMIADTVAGTYLINDPDFTVGDRVKTGDVEGTVDKIDLRKSRFKLDNGNKVVMANQEVEKKWTKITDQG